VPEFILIGQVGYQPQDSIKKQPVQGREKVFPEEFHS
jgi:hypothetical protein